MPPPTDDVDVRFRVGLTVLLLAIAVWGVVDLALDWPASPHAFHVAVELIFIGLALGSTAFLWRGWMRARRGLRLAEARQRNDAAERDLWHRRAVKLLRGLGVEIDAQFARWSLTPAEREVAMLLLKGYGHKQAAAVLERSERTVRQHAVSVYRKAGLAGRAELAAFFLEDLLLPAATEESGIDAAESPPREARLGA